MGGCRYFDGNDYINFGSPDVFSGFVEFTYVCWINNDDLTVNSQASQGKWSAAKKPFFSGINGTGKFVVSVGPGDDVSQRVIATNSNLSALKSSNTWIHCAGTNSLASASGNVLYLDGTSTPSSIIYDILTDSSVVEDSVPYFIGALDASTWLTSGKIAFSAVYNTRLNQEAIAEIQFQPFSFVANTMVPCLDSGSSEAEIGNGLTGTVTGATENFDGPPVFLLGGQ